MPKRERYAVQTADQTVNSSTVLVDTELTIQAEANRVYQLDCILRVSTPAAADMDIAITLPAGATFIGILMDQNGTYSAQSWDGSEKGLLTNSGAIGIKGSVVLGATPGDVTVQFAQTTSNVGDTTIQKGSYLKLERISQGAV